MDGVSTGKFTVGRHVSVLVLLLTSSTLVKAAVVTDCVAGERFDSGVCTPCEVGTFQALPAESSCRSCPLHMTTTSARASTFTDCICAAGYHMSESGYICIPCADGDCETCHKDSALVECAGVLHIGPAHGCVFYPCTKTMKCWGNGRNGELVSEAVRTGEGGNFKQYGELDEDWGENFQFSAPGNIREVEVGMSNTCVILEDRTAKC
jgi:hypothetical protein